MPRYSNANNTDVSVKHCYEELRKYNPQMTKTEFGELLNSNRQNIGQRISRDSKLSKQEYNILKEFLEDRGLPTKMLNVAVINDSIVQVPVRNEVELSCGTGSFANADFVSDTIGLDINFIRSFGGNPKTVSVVFARGDSMADRIESGDALIVDESKTYINSGKVYAFVYDSELFCKQLKKTSDGITAISFNKEYEPFEIDKTKQFAVVGQVISAMKRI
jgi:phage repressor protein C with HTH and peptisase S24 domain